MVKKNVLWILLLLISSCATFSKRGFKKNHIKINNKNYNLLNGTYRYRPLKELNIKNSKHLTYGHFDINSFDLLTGRTTLKKKDSIYSNQSNSIIELKIINRQKLVIDFKKDGYSIKRDTVKINIKKGMLVLDNKRPKIRGIPYLFGNYSNDKRRIGITKEENLIINEAFTDGGALLLIMGDEISGNISYEFDKIK